MTDTHRLRNVGLWVAALAVSALVAVAFPAIVAAQTPTATATTTATASGTGPVGATGAAGSGAPAPAKTGNAGLRTMSEASSAGIVALAVGTLATVGTLAFVAQRRSEARR